MKDEKIRSDIEYSENMWIWFIENQKLKKVAEWHRQAIKFELKSKCPAVYNPIKNDVDSWKDIIGTLIFVTEGKEIVIEPNSEKSSTH